MERTKTQSVPKKSLGSGKEAIPYPAREFIYTPSYPYTKLHETMEKLAMKSLTDFCYGLLVWHHIVSS